jgi:hypothetical protein
MPTSGYISFSVCVKVRSGFDGMEVRLPLLCC